MFRHGPRQERLLQLQRAAGNRAVTGLLGVQRLKGEATEEVLDHIFHGEVGKDDFVAGYHSENQAAARETIALVPDDATRTTGGLSGIYKAQPIAAKPGAKGKGGKALKPKQSGSSFFPASWNRATVTAVIEGSQRVSKSNDYNRMGAHNGAAVPMRLAGETLYPVFVREEVESDDDGGKGGAGKKGARGRGKKR